MRCRILACVVFAAALQACSEHASSSHQPVDNNPISQILANASCDAYNDIQQLGGKTMGTQWTLLWRNCNAPDAKSVSSSALETALSGELERINALMSTWDPQSELSLFNRYAGSDPVELHVDTLNVIDTALQVSVLTAGRYDITLAPVIDLWGFNQDKPLETPDDSAINKALKVSGAQLLVRTNNTLRKRQALVSVDVSSLAKGFAVDSLGVVVESFGIEHYLLDIGGELSARGLREGIEPWRVGIESPEGQVTQRMALRDTHVASSGSYRNFKIENGKRLSHIIDGATGRPVEHDLVSVTVVHQSTMLADAWATALLVVGATDAQQLIKRHNLQAQLTVYRNGEFERIADKHFHSLLF